MALLATKDLSIGYHSAGKRKLVGYDLSLTLRPGKLTALLGSNGSGKSTLIRTLAGLQPALEGTVLLESKALSSWPVSALPKKIAVVLQEKVRYANLTTFELVSLGRTPYTNWLGTLSDADNTKTNDSLHKAGIGHLSKRNITELSDGEWQKTMFSRALAQDTPVILLDEPTAHLDLLSKIELVEILKRAAVTEMKSVLFSTHDLDIALKMADQVWLMDGNGHITDGVPEDLILQGKIDEIYAKDSIKGFDSHTGEIRIPAVPNNKEITISGSGISFYWTRRALERSGYSVRETDSNQATVQIEESETVWRILTGTDQRQVQSIGELLEILGETTAAD